MISDQDRLNAWMQISAKVSEIAHKAVYSPILEQAMANRINQSPTGHMVVRPRKGDGGLLTFDSIWHSAPATIVPTNLRIYPCFAEDANIHEELAKFMAEVEFGGCYNPSIHTIFVNMDSGETLLYNACVVIHELGHSRCAMFERRAFIEQMPPREHRVTEEMDMRTFDYHLLSFLGGPSYQSEAEDLARKIMRHRTGQQKRMPPLDGKGAALDYCWGPVESANLKYKRDTLFGLFCELMAIDRYAPSSDTARQTKFNLINRHYDEGLNTI